MALSSRELADRFGDRLDALALGQCLGEPELDLEGDHLLLGAVVEVSFQPPALRVLSRHQPPSRKSQLFRAIGEFGVELDIAQEQSGSGGNVSQQSHGRRASPDLALPLRIDRTPNKLATVMDWLGGVTGNGRSVP